MYCPACGQNVKDNARFCENCGTQLQASSEVAREVAYEAPARVSRQRSKVQDPYKVQIDQLKLHLKQLKLYLKQINTKRSNTRAQHNETSAFLPEGFLKKGFKWIEDFQLLGTEQQKQQLQDEIIRVEQELLNLEQARARWKAVEQV